MLHVAPQHIAMIPWIGKHCYYLYSWIPVCSALLHPAFMVSALSILSGLRAPPRHWTCECCTAFWGHISMDRCGFPHPHSKLGKSKPVQIWKSCICTYFTNLGTALGHSSYTDSRGGWHPVGLKSKWGKYVSVCTCPGQYIWVNSIIIRKIRLGFKIRDQEGPPTVLNLSSYCGYQSFIWWLPQIYQALKIIWKLSRICLHALFLEGWHPEHSVLVGMKFSIPIQSY